MGRSPTAPWQLPNMHEQGSLVYVLSLSGKGQETNGAAQVIMGRILTAESCPVACALSEGQSRAERDPGEFMDP